jgi:hypothetical protein
MNFFKYDMKIGCLNVKFVAILFMIYLNVDFKGLINFIQESYDRNIASLNKNLLEL